MISVSKNGHRLHCTLSKLFTGNKDRDEGIDRLAQLDRIESMLEELTGRKAPEYVLPAARMAKRKEINNEAL